MSRLQPFGSLLRAACRPLRYQPANAPIAAKSPRFFSSLPSLRPTLPSQRPTTSALRPSAYPLAQLPGPTSLDATAADVVPRTSITAHPALAGPGVQIRCGPRPTLETSSRLIRQRRHGFLSRIRTKNGRKTLRRRRAKGRKRLAC